MSNILTKPNSKPSKIDIANLETGDLLLFTNKSSGLMGFFTSMIRWATHSNYTHTAIVLKDPDFIDPPLKGTYIWESGWEGTPDPQDGKVKLGVQITAIETVVKEYSKIGHIYLRKLKTEKSKAQIFNTDTLKKIHKIVYDKPYDIVPLDWIEAFFQKDLNPQKITRFWCSAFVSYVYTKCGLLDPNTDWTIVPPYAFALSSENLKFTEGNSLANCEIRIL